MKTWEFRCNVTLSGAQLYVEAETEAEARRLIEAHKWTDEEVGGASWVNVEITQLAASYDHDEV